MSAMAYYAIAVFSLAVGTVLGVHIGYRLGRRERGENDG